MGRPQGCGCCGEEDCLGCFPSVIEDPDLAMYCYVTAAGLSWGMPVLDTGSLGPFSLWNSFQGARWECPSWYSGGGLVCGTEFLDSAMFEWRLDTVDVAGFNGTRKAVRIDPDTNKCYWSWSTGKVLNIYHRGSVIAWNAAADNAVSIEPEFQAELHDLVAGSVEGTIVDPGTDGLTGLCASDLTPEVHRFDDYFTYGEIGWRKSRFLFGLNWHVTAVEISGVWKWLLTGSTGWAWTWRNTAKYKTGTVQGPTVGPYTRVGHYAARDAYGGTGTSSTLWRAGVRVPNHPDGSGMPNPACGVFLGAVGAVKPGDLLTPWGAPVTQEIIQNLATTPSSTPPGHRLWRGSGGSAIDFHNQIAFQYVSDDPINCAADLFAESTIAMSLHAGLPDVDDGHYANSFGLSLPATCELQFSNT
jgi:hypothetical protein